MYLFKRVCAIITLRRIFDIVYVQNFISSPVIKQMIHLIYFHNPLFFYKIQFLSSKIGMIRLSMQLQSITNFPDDVILISALRSYLLKTYRGDFSGDKYKFACTYVSFCIELNTFVRLRIANSFLFLIFQWCYFYVLSQSTFPDQIRPRPLIACLNCAALSP